MNAFSNSKCEIFFKIVLCCENYCFCNHMRGTLPQMHWRCYILNRRTCNMISPTKTQRQVIKTFSCLCWYANLYTGLELVSPRYFYSLRQNCRHFPDDIFKYIILNENVRISLMIALRFVSKIRINNILALVHIGAACIGADQATNHYLYQWWLVDWLTFITRPQWVNRARQLVGIMLISHIFYSVSGYYYIHLPFNDQTMITSSNGNICRITGLLCGEFTGHRWIPHTKANDAELWYFLIYAWIDG